EATGYMIRFNDGNWQLLRWDDGTAVELDSAAASVVIDTDYEMKIRVEGSTITGYVDDVEVLSATDSTYTAAGLVGVYSHGNGAAPTETTRAHLSDFGARNIPSGGVVEQQPGYLASDEPQSDQQSSYTAGREAVEDQQSGYLRVTGGEQEQQSGYLHGLEATSDQQPSYLLAGDAISEQQSAHLHGQENLADSQPAYLRSGVKLEVSTGKMLNDRFSVTTYTNEWMYLNSAEAGFVHTYADARWGDQAHGKLLNLRMVQAAFQHEGDTGYPAAFDPAQNTADFIAALPDYKAAGILAMTIGMQGGNPNYGTNGSD